ncbi:hypothetical protein V5O48_006940 [Marasmius crinis-equi]|uniref:Ino eighty subunit 1 n=1 Tax=Marasmius crinis-equi TaxID=585013 RepID=A0ABR3FI38_9AGAR
MSSRKQSIKVLKKNDGEPLFRADIQFALLNCIFTDTLQVFTDPYQTLDGRPPRSKVTFRDLYVNAIIHSPKTPKALKDKMAADLAFATDYAMICLLANVGRINTTMSFFPEMKTAIRTYHPVPSLQKTGGSLQDAPRHKAILKASLLEGETNAVPTTPAEILSRASSGTIPPTNIANLIFVLANHSVSIGATHFSSEFEFLDLFTPVEFSSASRARVFLWICYHYYEAPSSENEDDYDNTSTSENPYCDPNRPGKYPPLQMLTSEQAETENLDPEDEKQHAEKLIAQRTLIQRAQGPKEVKTPGKSSAAVDEDIESVISVDSAQPSTLKGAKGKEKKSKSAKEKKGAPDADGVSSRRFGREEPFGPMGPYDPSRNVYPTTVDSSRPRIIHQPNKPSPAGQSSSSRYTPYGTPLRDSHRDRVRTVQRRRSPSRSMLEHAWHVINQSDPLLDSDEESLDEHHRQDYTQRLRVLSRLRAKDPTPEPQPQPPYATQPPPLGVNRA